MKLSSREREDLYASRLTWMDDSEMWRRYLHIRNLVAFADDRPREQTFSSGEPQVRVRITVKEIFYCKEDFDRWLAWDAEKRLR